MKRKGDKIPVDADVHLHWRFFFDPPELMTTFVVTSADAADHEELEGVELVRIIVVVNCQLNATI